MKKISLLLVTGIISCWISFVSAQSSVIITENFDGNNNTFTPSSSSDWKINTNYYVSSPNSIRGIVPRRIGDSIELVSPIYNLTQYVYVRFQFRHICKVSQLDIARVEYRTNMGSGMGAWEVLPVASYLGSANPNHYAMYGFNDYSYSEWKSGDSLAQPNQSWWREEDFDLSSEIGQSEVQFRFVLKHGNTSGTQISYGWLIDDIKLTASLHPLTMEFVGSYPKDTVYSVGPYDITVKIKTTMNIGNYTPLLIYTSTLDGASKTDTALMEQVGGDTLWQGTIPPFFLGTEVTYYITGKDSIGYYATLASSYIIKKPADITGPSSASVYSIDINDTIAVVPGWPVPIIVTIKNKGDSVLKTATVYYAVNGGTPQSYNWTGNLLWDYNQQDSIGNYIPKVNGRDTITVWVKLPNGVPDNATSDDTLTKIIYGNIDIDISFVNQPADTVYSTGPFGVSARISSMSGKYSGTLSLDVVSSNGSTFNLPMNAGSVDNEWETTIPHIQFGNRVTYSISLIDVLGNTITIVDSFYIKQVQGNVTGDIVIGIGTVDDANTPISLRWQDLWGRQLYLASELDPALSAGGLITKLAWYHVVTTASTWSKANQTCYFRAVDDTNITSIVWEDPLKAGATQVWAGTIGASGASGWVEMVLDRPFLLPPHKNLLVYWHDESGTYPAAGLTWRHTTTTQNMTVYGRCDCGLFGLPTTTNGTLTTARPNARFSIIQESQQSNSVALVAIESPSFNAKGNVPTPVLVRIRNKGTQNLMSCTLNWKMNGVTKPPVTYTAKGNGLLFDFSDTISLGDYTPTTFGNTDTIIVWVNNPNATVDPNTYDDTLKSLVFVAQPSGPMNGDYIIGTSTAAHFATLDIGFAAIKNSGINGKVRFLLENGTYPYANIASNLANIMTAKDTFVLTSLSGKASDVIITSSITLSGVRNIQLQAITVKLSSGNGLILSGPCKNIVIRDCELLSSSTSGYLIYRGNTSTGVFDSVFIINNVMNGGGYGIMCYGTGDGPTQFASNIIFDSNTITNQNTGGCYLYRVHFISFSHNTILSRTSGTTTWYGIYLSRGNIQRCVGNHIRQRSTTMSSSRGIAVEYFNYFNTTDTGLIANNEIILYTATANVPGINVGSYSRAKILHNSIYIKSTTATRGINIVDNVNNWVMIKNNNIYLEQAESYPIYLNNIANLNLYDIDYNNLYAPKYVGYAAANKETIAAWQQTITTDKSSIYLPCTFANDSTLQLTNYNGFECTSLSEVPVDKDGQVRVSMTSIGCYDAPPATGNAKLTTIIGLREGHVLGQTDSIKVAMTNTGATTITSVNMGWSVNGVIQNNNVNIPISLSRGESITVPVGELNYNIPNKVSVKIWINNLNGGNLADAFADDDTISLSVFICDGNFSGTFTVGNTGYFNTIEEAYNAIKLCGVDGDVTLAFQTGTHSGILDLSNNATLFGNYFLTVTSVTGNASDVTFSSSTEAVIRCDGTSNVIFRDIIIDASQGNYGIQFTGTGGGTNIVVENCHIKANPASTQTYYACIYHPSNTGSLDGLTVKNCTLDGGYYGIYLYGPWAYDQNVIIDSNTFTNQMGRAISFWCVNFKSVSYNHITPLAISSSEWNAFYGVYLEGGTIMGNRIFAQGLSLYVIRGMYFSIMANSLVANNEIYINANAATNMFGFNLLLYQQNTRFINNTVHTVNTNTSGTNRAFYYDLTNTAYTTSTPTIRNNIFSVSGGDAANTHAFYYYGTAANFNAYKGTTKVDYNDYYSTGTNIGYAGGTDYPTLTAWKTFAAPLDSHSVNLLPVFSNPNINLILANNSDTLLCPVWQEVPTDIQDVVRPSITSMGAYSQSSNGLDLGLLKFSEWQTEVIQNQIVPVNVTLINTGTVPITNATFGWSVNGVNQTSKVWTAAPTLNTMDLHTINIGSFPITSTANYNIVVWIKDVNGKADTLNWNDTLRASAALKPLAEFVSPFVSDTITDLSFTVSTLIRSWTGATQNIAKMTIVSTVHGTDIIHDTVSIKQNGDFWQADIPPQYYGTKVVYSLTVSDTLTPNNTITIIDSTYIRSALSILGDRNLIGSLYLSKPLTTTRCMEDSSAVEIILENKGTKAYNFSRDTIIIGLEIIDPDTIIYMASVPFAGVLQSGFNPIELMSALPVIRAGTYHIKAWIGSSTDNTPYEDTLYYDYISGKKALPIDEDFHNGISSMFEVRDYNTTSVWKVVSQGSGTDLTVVPNFGDSMLSFGGSAGIYCTFATRQMDLSRTKQPSLSFWYFHDTILCDDYTDVGFIVNETRYTPLFHLTKYDTVYGWKQYNVNLPAHAVNQCVIVVFEAMEMSITGNVTQYIDRILISARQDISLSEIIIPELTGCNLQNNELKVTLTNLEDPILDYTDTLIVTLEVKQTGQAGQTFIFKDTLTSGFLAGNASDTILLATGFDFTKGTYTFKSYFSSVFDVDRDNDTLETSIVLNPELKVTLNKISGNNTCLSGESLIHQDVILTNTGNMDLYDIDLILQIDTGQTGDPAYAILKETCTDTIHVDDTITYSFISAYKVPWDIGYYPRIYAYLSCDSSLVNATTAIIECVDMEDLYMVSIDNPSTGNDTIGAPVQVKATIQNRSDVSSFSNRNITFVVENSQRVETAKFTETIAQIGILATVSHTFVNTYTVPNDSVYYLTVYIDNNDNYSANDTLIIERRTEKEDKDLFIVSIDNPSSGKDVVGSSVQVSASLRNGSEYEDFAGLRITVLVENSQGIQTETFSETTSAIGKLSTENHTFTQSYTVPNDSVYRLTVYIDSYDNYPQNDTARITRHTESVDIAPIGSTNAFTLGQNIPNPATNSTRIDYSVPEAGKVIFHVHSISGQLLYSRAIEASRGANSIELNTTTFAAGVYFYSMEYKGQRLVRQLIIK